MIAVYSLWLQGRANNPCGFPSVDDMMACMKLSMVQSAKFFDRVILVTDTLGAERIKAYKVPCDEVRIEFDNLPYNPKLWSIPKLLALKSVNQPMMMHIDNDFIWTAYRPEIMDGADMVFQCAEPYDLYSYYDKTVPYIKEHYPDIYTTCLSDTDYAYNCGVIGMRDPGIMDLWLERAHQLMDASGFLDSMPAYELWKVLLVFEQSFIANICVQLNLKVKILDPEYHHTYRHFLGTQKNSVDNMKLVRDRLKFEEKYLKTV